ncbi:ATP-dependent DNA helicase [Trichonephila clavipes]|nr:ATP-dependent DNA helicase [Trichonephila clavipes]
MDQVNNDLCFNEALRHIEDKIIRIYGKKLSNFGMPTPQRRGELLTDLIKELSYNTALLDTQRGTAADEINACLKASYLWTKVEKLYLTTNMRVQLFSGVESGAYTQKLLEIDEGHLDTDQEGMVLFTHQFCHVVESEDELIDQVFPKMQQHILDEKWLCERTILAPKNETVAKIN